MTADLRFVTHATQGHAHELAVGGTGQGLAEGGLAHTGRADQAEHRAFQLAYPLLDRQILDNALLDLIQPVVVAVQHLLGVIQVMPHLGGLLPGYIGQPFDIGAHHGRFGGHRRHHLELVQLGLGLLQGLLAHARRLDALLQLIQLAGAVLGRPHLLLDGLHLLVQIVLALAALHLLLDPAADAFFHLQQVDLGIQYTQYMLDPVAHRGDFQDLLLLLDLEVQVGSHGVNQSSHVLYTGQGADRLRRYLLAQIDELLELAHQGARQYLGLSLLRQRLLDQLDAGLLITVNFLQLLDLGALFTLHQHLDGTVRQLEQLQYGGQGAYAVQVLCLGVIDGGVALGHQQNLLVALHGGFQCLDRFAATNEQGNDHVGEYHHITQWQ